MPVIIPIYSGPPKVEIVRHAYEEAGIVDLSAEDLTLGLSRLNALMGTMRSLEGIDVGYAFPTNGPGLLDEASGIPDDLTETIALRLAFRVMPTIGKTASGETRGSLAQRVSLLKAQYSCTPCMDLPCDGFRGQGNRRRWF